MRLLAAAATVVACSRGSSGTASGSGSGSGTGSGSGSGSDDGFVIRDKLAQRTRTNGDQLLIQLVSVPGVCELYNASQPTPTRDYDIITIELQNIAGPIARGKHEVAEGGSTDGTRAQVFYVGNRNCRTRFAAPATGMLDLTVLDDHRVAGSYVLDFAQGWPYPQHELVGSFDAPYCVIDPNKVATLTCK